MMSVSRLGTLVSTNWLKKQILSVRNQKDGPLRILETSWLPDRKIDGYKDYYSIAHIPGAVYFDINYCSKESDFIPWELPDSNFFTDYVQSLGICKNTHVITYDCLNSRSSVRGWWMFRVFGHEKVSILDGGLLKWLENGFEVTTEEPHVERSNDFQAKFNPALFRDYGAILKNLETKTEQLVDTRVPDSYHGIMTERPTMKPGHIPGSKGIPFADLFNPDGTFKSLKDLKMLLDDAGIDLDKPLTATCLLGFTACGLAAAAQMLGKEVVPIYGGSYTEWGQRADPQHCVIENK